jgi:hypothetical protein
MRRAAKVDANHAAIRDAMRQFPGVTVRDTSHVGDGFPDLIVGFRNRTLLVEIKDGAKVKSARKLTDHQRRFHEQWTGSPIWIVESVSQAMDLLIQEARA